MPRQRAASVTAESASRAATTSGLAGSGITTVNAASPFHPSTSAPPSTETMSPARNGRSPGMPCTTSSSTETQSVCR